MRIWLMKITMVLERLIEAVSLRSAWLISRACRPGMLSPISPSSSARGTRPVAIRRPPARQPAEAERDVEAERAGRDGVDLDVLVALAEPHDRALAETALDLGERGIKGLRFVHG